MGKIKTRILRLEKRMGRPNPFASLSSEELWGIICAHEWTEEELDSPCRVPLLAHLTYRQLISIAGRVLGQS